MILFDWLRKRWSETLGSDERKALAGMHTERIQ